MIQKQHPSRKSSPVQRTGVVIVGAGFGGLCMAIKLLEAGVEDLVILEKADEVGGTWRDNTYPGCACDVQSHLYSYSFHGKPDWSKRYAPWQEIQQYILDTTEAYGLRQKVRFGQEVIAAHYQEDTARWQITTERGDRFDCQYWVLASGPLHVPQYPAIPGLDRFQGEQFHSARWNHDYDLRGKRVVSIGTGGSAIQYCPEIAPEVERLTVLQRTPAWVIPRDERRYFGLEKALFRRYPLLRKLHRARLYWSNEARVWPIFHPSLAKGLQQLAKLSIRLQVKDRDTARALTPDYTVGCKRVLISNAWYPMFNRDNVELVTEGVREVRANSVVTADGREHPADCLIFGTGFQVDPRLYMKGFELSGAGGHTLAEDWQAGVEGYMGTMVHGYPNMFQLVGPNAGLGHNSIIFMIECQADYIVNLMNTVTARGADYVDVTEGAQCNFNDEVARGLEGTVWTSGCSSWYQQADGRNFALWPFSTWRYWLRTRFLALGDFQFGRCAGSLAEQPEPVADQAV
ncbi:flavin-containing monooxygenase [Marinobacter xestospongiae]|uniref:NAD(P)/FAD-dependent oxidoreductase n=1 Tax=Marinobacter xestospongiae TaxID=994319 RepID=A0ABU3VX65_9GAMM|nr:NAD(P)/FAD-dependent oxidoreductase [Marinobacter xestospongiae]MDV2078869.1 NAD(P)/FAD-dependent oxidoreductase [Marinobacter xestospongiae]